MAGPTRGHPVRATAAAPGYAEGSYVPLSTDLLGNLRISLTGAAAVTQGTSPWVISGGVTANAGTNLNTSLLALESGGNLAAIKAKTDNLDALLSSLLQPADTLTALGSLLNALPTGTNTIGKVDQGTGGASAWKVDGSAVTQPISFASPQHVIVDSAATIKNPHYIQTDNLTTANQVGTTVDATASPCSLFALKVKGVGAVATSWTVTLGVSLDGTDFTVVLTHTNANSDATIIFPGSSRYPGLYFRAKVQAVVLGTATAIACTVFGM